MRKPHTAIDLSRVTRAGLTFAFAVALSATYVACSSTEFGAQNANTANSASKKGGNDQLGSKQGDDKSGIPPIDQPVKNPDGTMTAAFQSKDGDYRRDLFEFGKDVKPVIADYLFVLDNSPSMDKNVTKLKDGFRSLSADLFPKDARVGVMYTFPAEIGSLNTPMHTSQEPSAAAAAAEPGFLRLVDKSSIASYKSAAGAAGSVFTSPGCDNGWFKPDEKDSSGTRCFDAHSVISLKGGPCEAGITTYRQILERMGGSTRLFRSSSIAHVIFVSDTHDPGCNATQKGDLLKAQHLTFSELKAKTEVNSSGIASLKFHGIVPASTCALSEGTFYFGMTYHDLVNQAGGKLLDLCTATDFKGVLEQIVSDTSVQTPIFKLGKASGEILWVEVNGAKVTTFTVKDDQTIEVTGLDATKTQKIEIAYKVK